MPQRSTPKQRVIALLRELLAVEGFTVTESKQLPDRRTGKLREVDVVMEGKLNDVDVRICWEVVDHRRKATVPWVEQMLGKHAHLETNKLYLVSWSGFTEDCPAVARAGGAELVTVDLSGPGPTLYVGRIDVTPTRMVFTVVQPDGSKVPVQSQRDTHVFDSTGKLLGEAASFIEALREPEVGRRLLEMAYEHPGRDRLTHFQVRLQLQSYGLYLRNESDGALYPIEEIQLVGNFLWKMEPLDLHIAAFLETPFAFGQSTVAEHDVLAVALLDAMGAPSRVSLNLQQSD